MKYGDANEDYTELSVAFEALGRGKLGMDHLWAGA